MSMEETDDNVKMEEMSFCNIPRFFFTFRLTIQWTLRNIPVMKQRFTDEPLRVLHP